MEINDAMKDPKNIEAETLDVWNPDGAFVGHVSKKTAMDWLNEGLVYLGTTTDIVWYK